MNIYIFASRNLNDQSKSKIKRLRIRLCDKIVLLNTPNDESIDFLLNKKKKIDWLILDLLEDTHIN